MKKSIILASISLGLCFLFLLSAFAAANEKTTRFSINPTQGDADSFIYLPLIAKPVQPKYKIAFASNYDNVSGRYDIYLMNTDGTGLRNLTNTPDISEASPVWSPDGAMIAYTALEGFGNLVDIFIMDADGENSRNVSNALTSDHTTLSWSPNSQRLAFASDAGNDLDVFDIFVVNQDGTGLTNVTNSAAIREQFPEWSANSAQIVFSAKAQDTSNTSIAKVNANGSGRATVYADAEGSNYWPKWIPNSSKISFIKAFPNPDCLVTVEPDGTDASCVSNLPGVYIAQDNRWNMAGTKLLLQGYDPNESYWQYLFVFEYGTGEVQKLVLCTPGSAFGWSPDQSQITYVAPKNYSTDIFIANSDGTAPVNLTESLNSSDIDPNWSPIPIP